MRLHSCWYGHLQYGTYYEHAAHTLSESICTPLSATLQSLHTALTQICERNFGPVFSRRYLSRLIITGLHLSQWNAALHNETKPMGTSKYELR